MANRFDSLKRTAFDVVTRNMGYNATWLPSGSTGEPYTAQVGYKDPSEKQELSGIDSWNPDEPFLEYRVDFFPGLKAAADDRRLEVVEVEGIGLFSVVEVKTKYDGDTYVARLRAVD